MFKKIITIVLPIIAVTAAIFIFGLKVYQDSFDRFQYDGYVIGSSTGKESAKYHFTKDEKYKVNNSNNEVEFTNSEEKEVTIPDASFVHYADGSISTFKKAVVLNLENVKTDSLQYYNIFKGSVFTKTNEGYQIQYLEDKLLFNNFIVKISDTKYMIVGKNLEIGYGDKKEIIKDGFLEINYLDGNIIRIENQDFLLQNISSDFTIKVEGVDLDLLNKKIIYEEETKVNLGEITIDSDDNIEIIPDENNTVIDPEEMNKIEELENAPVVTPGSNVDGMESGIVDTTIEKADEIIQENETIPDAVFKTVLFDVTPSSMSATVSVEDSANTLKGEMTWKIIENSSNSIICQNRAAQGRKTIEVECSSLSPETNYSLIVSSKYEKNEVTYEKDFLQRTFITTSAGVSIEKDYVSTTMVAYKVKIPDASTLTTFSYEVIESANPDNVVQSGKFVRTHSSTSNCNNEEASVDGTIPKVNECKVLVTSDIKPNVKYSLIIKEIVHGTLAMPDTFEVYKSVTTLKQKPSFGGTNVITNKMASNFSISLNTVTDPNNSILSYRADIFPLNTQDDESTIVATREAAISNQIDVNVDGETLIRGNNYVAKIYVTYFDNEKEYDVLVGTSDVMNMTSVEAPKVRFEEIGTLHDSIRGNIVITDASSTIVDGTIKFKVLNMSEATQQEFTAVREEAAVDRVTTSYTIELDNLQANTDYRFVVQAQVILEKNLNEPVFANIGEFIVKTKMPSVQKAWIEDNTREETGHYFAIRFMLTPDKCTVDGKKVNCYKKDENGRVVAAIDDTQALNAAWHEIKTIKNVKFRLRKKDDDYIKTDAECRNAEYCWTFNFTDNQDAYDDSDIINMFYPANYANGTSDIIPTFRPLGENNTNNVMALDLQLGDAEEEGGGLPKDRYVLELLSATDYTPYNNPIETTQTSIEFMTNGQAEQDVVTFTEKLTTDKDGNKGYQITTKQTITEFVTLKEEGVEYESKESFIHYLVNLNTNAVCEIGRKEADAVNGSNSMVTNAGKTLNFTFANYNNLYKDNEDCQIKLGNSYGYFYEYVLDVEAGDGRLFHYEYGAYKTFREFKAENQPQMEKAKIQVILSKTEHLENEEIRYVFKYNIQDPTGSLGKNPQFVYKGASDENAKNVYCGADYKSTSNCVTINNSGNASGTFAIGKVNGGSVSISVDYNLLLGATGSFEANDIDNMLKEYEYNVEGVKLSTMLVKDLVIEDENIFGDAVTIYYEVDESETVQNAITYTFPRNDINGNAINLQYSIFTRYFVGAKLTLSNICAGAGCVKKTVVLYRSFDNNGYQNQREDGPDPQITISYGEITELMSATDQIETKVELLYDMNHYGFDTENTDVIALQSYRTAYTFEKMDTSSGLFRNSKISCNINDDKCTLTYRSNDQKDAYYDEKGNPETSFVLKKENGSLYYEPTVGTKKYLQVKKLKTHTGLCDEEHAHCKFTFSSIIPTIYMEDKQVQATYGGVRYITDFAIAQDILKNVETGASKDFRLRIYYYADEALTTPIKHNGTNYVRTIKYEDFESYANPSGVGYVFTESELLQKTKYYAVFKWTNSENNTAQDFYYDANWHLKNPGKKTRVYSFNTSSTRTFMGGTDALYEKGSYKKYTDTGNINTYHSNKIGVYSEYAYNQSPNSNRSLQFTYYYKPEPNDVIDGYNVRILLDHNDDEVFEDTWESYTVTRDDFKSYSSGGIQYRYITKMISIDPKTVGGVTKYFDTNSKIKMEIQPYQSCIDANDPGNTSNKCTGGIRYFDTYSVVKSYYISDPTVTIVRKAAEDAANAKHFKLQVTVNDQYRAVGKYAYKEPETNLEIQEEALYTIKVYADNVEVKSIPLTSYTPSKTFRDTDVITECEHATSCRVEVEYMVDRTNSDVPKEKVVKTKNINLNYAYDSGTIARGSVSAKKINILFTGSFRLSENVKLYDAIISHETFADINISKATPTITTKSSSTKQLTITLPDQTSLKLDELYSITVQFRNEEEVLLDEWSAEGISYSSS